MNSVVLQGNVTREPEVKVFAGGSQVTEFGVAVNRRVKKNDEWVDEVNFFDVKYWGKKGLGKGDAVVLKGELRQETWETDGNKRSKVVVVADTVTLFTGYKKSTQSQPSAPDNFEVKGDEGKADDEIPF